MVWRDWAALDESGKREPQIIRSLYPDKAAHDREEKRRWGVREKYRCTRRTQCQDQLEEVCGFAARVQMPQTLYGGSPRDPLLDFKAKFPEKRGQYGGRKVRSWRRGTRAFNTARPFGRNQSQISDRRFKKIFRQRRISAFPSSLKLQGFFAGSQNDSPPRAARLRCSV